MINDLIISELEHFRKQKIQQRNYILLILTLISILLLIIIILLFPKDSSMICCMSIIIYIKIFIIIASFFQNQYSREIKKLLINIISKIPNFEEFKIIKYSPEETDFLKNPLLTLYPEASTYKEEDYLEIEFNNTKVIFAEVEINKIEYKKSLRKRKEKYKYFSIEFTEYSKTVENLFKGIVIVLPKKIFDSSSANIIDITYTVIPNFQDNIFIFYPHKKQKNYFEFSLSKRITEEYIQEKISEITQIFNLIRTLCKKQ
ncbi:MAG: hypothetical protein RMJ36_02835 [Candidatus Calescibacterium sp.]|nr:hypothetical protein [Candidatus Calescibacterium sp.]MDW8132574.1 hypothetical protein [Candidatus Calescibacterium sp.]